MGFSLSTVFITVFVGSFLVMRIFKFFSGVESLKKENELLKKESESFQARIVDLEKEVESLQKEK